MTVAAEPVIRTEGLTKSYHGRPALRGISLTVPPGCVFGYLGPNGAGKTTTIRILAGLLRPTTGRAWVNGRDVVRQREQVKRDIGYLPGDFVAYPRLTGRQYLEFLANLRGGVAARAIEDLADRLNVSLTERIGQLSHGNRQKIGIIQAFMHDPDLLILDEPTNGLDPLVQREFLALVREVRESGRSVLISSHVLSEVEALADVVGMLRQGELVIVESVDELKARSRRHMHLTFDRQPPLDELRRLDGIESLDWTGDVVDLTVAGSTTKLFDICAPYGIRHITTHEPDLEEIFLTYYATEADDVAQRVH